MTTMTTNATKFNGDNEGDYERDKMLQRKGYELDIDHVFTFTDGSFRSEVYKNKVTQAWAVYINYINISAVGEGSEFDDAKTGRSKARRICSCQPSTSTRRDGLTST